MNLRLANSPESRLGLANALTIDAEGWAIIPYGDSHHNAADGRAAANDPVPENLRRGVIQRFDRAAAETIVADFRSLWGRVKRALVGLPVYRGHPDAPRFANLFPDRAPRGTIAEMRVTDEGLQLRPVLTETGAAEVEGGLGEFSPYWDLTLVEGADPSGLPVYRPTRLHSIGLVRRGNIPGLSLTNDSPAMKQLLLRLLAALGIEVPADAADDAFGPHVERALEKLNAATQAAEQTKTAANASAQSLAEAKARITALESEKGTLAAANTQAQAALRSEREARAALVVDRAIAEGRVAPAERAARCTTLANAADFGAEAAALQKLPAGLRTRTALADLGPSGRDQQDRQQRLIALVNARMGEGAASYDEAWAAVTASDAGKAILAAMKAPAAKQA